MTDKERIAGLEEQLEGLQEEQAAVLPEDCSLADWAKAWRERTADLEADRDRLRAALEGCLHVWTVNNLEAYVSGGKYIDDIVNRALSATGEHPDTVALRAVMEWLEEKEGAYPAGIFRPLTEEDTAKANAALQSAGVVHDRLSADISRLWCQQLREALDALKEAR